MIIKDPVYGKFNVKQPVIKELINCPSMVRLKDISQYGIPDKYYHYKNYSRYSHSLGVMILLSKLGASLEEQIAGLLHDVSILTFSHIADWVFGEGEKGVEGYHDSIHIKFILDSEIPQILQRCGFDADRISNLDNYPLLEKKIPSLCADRVDYTLRDFWNYHNPSLVNECFKHLTNYNNEIVFNDTKAAEIFSLNYLQLNLTHWGSYKSSVRYNIFSETLKYALGQNIINKEDFFTTETEIIEKLENSSDKEVQKALTILRNKSLDDFPSISNKKVKKKYRYVDPSIIIDGKTKRLSEVIPEYKRDIEHYRIVFQEGYVL
jgi:HD superfamily phosphohydrolase